MFDILLLQQTKVFTIKVCLNEVMLYTLQLSSTQEIIHHLIFPPPPTSSPHKLLAVAGCDNSSKKTGLTLVIMLQGYGMK